MGKVMVHGMSIANIRRKNYGIIGLVVMMNMIVATRSIIKPQVMLWYFWKKMISKGSNWPPKAKTSNQVVFNISKAKVYW